MGLTEQQAAELLAGLTPPTQKKPPDQKPDLVTEDPTIGNEQHIRGIPAVGRVSGTIKGTRPGDPAAALEQAGRDILRAHLNRNRYRPNQEKP